MANRTVTLMWMCKTDHGWRRVPVASAKNGRVKTGYGIVDGKEVHYPEGRFQIRYFEGAKSKWVNAGLNPTDALAMRDRLARKRTVIADAKVVGVEVKHEQGREPLRSAVGRYIERCRDVDAQVAASSYKRALGDFMQALPQIDYVDQIDEAALIKFGAALAKNGNGPRTVFNKHRSVLGFMRWLRVDIKAMNVRTPKYEKKVPRVYSNQQIEGLLAAADPYFWVVINVLNMAGLRDREAVHLEWSNLDFDRKIVEVRSKPKFKFKIKDREERDVPMPAALAEILQDWMKLHGKDELVLGTERGKPHKKWLRQLKRTALRAGMNCGRCESCLKYRECQRFTLHSFRRNYATRLHRQGLDARTIMGFLGHADIETTMRYLAPMTAEESQETVDAAFTRPIALPAMRREPRGRHG